MNAKHLRTLLATVPDDEDVVVWFRTRDDFNRFRDPSTPRVTASQWCKAVEIMERDGGYTERWGAMAFESLDEAVYVATKVVK